MNIIYGSINLEDQDLYLIEKPAKQKTTACE
jgi:hypothetical protein